MEGGIGALVFLKATHRGMLLKSNEAKATDQASRCIFIFPALEYSWGPPPQRVATRIHLGTKFFKVSGPLFTTKAVIPLTT